MISWINATMYYPYHTRSLWSLNEKKLRGEKKGKNSKKLLLSEESDKRGLEETSVFL
jgi:hypothetical protein